MTGSVGPVDTPTGRAGLPAGLLAVVAAIVLAGCAKPPAGGRDPLLSIPIPQGVTVDTGAVAGLGTILTDAQGHTLYMFPPDAGSQVRCTGPCAGTWPPLVIATGHRPAGAGLVNPADLGTIGDPNTGAAIVTYGGYPLYRYAGDLNAGVANGQNLFSDGGPWYALHPDMQPVTVNPSIPSGAVP